MQHFRDTNDAESDVENRPQAEKIKADDLGRTSRRGGRPASTPDQKVARVEMPPGSLAFQEGFDQSPRYFFKTPADN